MTRHVLVVGAGVIGLCTAYYALARGFAVTVVDRERQDRRSCSFGNAGLVVPSHFVPLAAPGAVRQGLAWMANPRSPFYIRPRPSLELMAWLVRFARSATREHVARAAPLLRDLCIASRASYEELARQPGADFEFVREGLLALCRTKETFAHETETAARARELGMPAEVLATGEAAKREPGIRSDLAGAIYYPEDCHLAPDRLMPWLEREIARIGGRIVWQTEVARWHRERDTLVAARTSMGEDIEADEFVLCGGSWSPDVARALGLSIPIQAGKGYSVTLPAHPNPPKHAALLCEARVAVTPMNGRLRIGGTMELAGLDRSIDARRVGAVVDSVGRYYTGVAPADFAGVEPWSGLRPCTPDGLPYIGRTHALRNFTAAAGHAMLGVTLGPVTGRIVAQVLSGETPPFDMAMLSPERFA